MEPNYAPNQSPGRQEHILAGATESFEIARSHYPESKQPEAALLVSCAVRKMLLGARTGEEMSGFNSPQQPSLPVCGFYAYGEIGPLADGATHFLNTTIVTLLLGT
ncbi:MAG TPA: FIST C-terminal domain-containing protein [Rhodothermales bacterium]|nr:FIST C-terminal domain-containing protein [Rhodothermales bacterium]